MNAPHVLHRLGILLLLAVAAVPVPADFHGHLERLGIPDTWTVLQGVDHDPLGTLEALGDDHWVFYRQAFRDTPGR